MSLAHKARHPSVLQACVAAAGQGADFLMEKMVDAARRALQEREGRLRDFHERGAVTEALQLLKKHERFLVGHYPAALAEAFVQDPVDRARAASLFDVRFDQLELMDDGEVQKSVEMARAHQQALHTADAALAELNPLICSAMGLPHVMTERNPLRPENYIEALQALVAKTQVSTAVRLVWMQHMCDLLGQELVQVYRSASQRLRGAGVVAVPFTAAPSYATPVGTGWDGFGGVETVAHVHAPPLASVTDGPAVDPLLTVSALRDLISGSADSGLATLTVARAPTSGFSMSLGVPSTLDFPELSGLDELEGFTSPQPIAGSAPPAFDATVPASLDDAADAVSSGPAPRDARPDPALAQEVIGLLVDNITRDGRLLPEVQQAVRALQPALLLLVNADPRFFSDREHPARRLLEEITQRSLAYADQQTAGFDRFMATLRDVVERLSDAFIVDAVPFQDAIDRLRAGLGEEAAADREARERAVQALLYAEQRNLLAERIGADIASLPEAARVPQTIRDFVVGPWSQVIAHARLSDRGGTLDPGGYAAIVPGLMWSAQPEATRRNVPRLTRTVPVLLGKLREGLRSLDIPAEQYRPFLELLISLHQAAFNPGLSGAGAAQEEGDGKTGGPEAGDRSVPSAAPVATGAAAADRPAASDAERAASVVPPKTGPEITAPAATGVSVPRSDGPAALSHRLPAAEPPAPAVSSMESQVRAATDAPDRDLAVGAWVELESQGRVTRMQLTWASPHGTMFLFTAVDGGTRSMTRRLHNKLAAEGTVRLVSAQPVVDGALDAVAAAAMRNSVGAG